MPNGVVVILKEVDLTSWAATSGQAIIQVAAGLDAAQVRLVNAAIANSEHIGLACWLVLEPGDSVACYLLQVPIDIVLSGAELPPRPGVATLEAHSPVEWRL